MLALHALEESGLCFITRTGLGCPEISFLMATFMADCEYNRHDTNLFFFHYADCLLFFELFCRLYLNFSLDRLAGGFVIQAHGFSALFLSYAVAPLIGVALLAITTS